jgi:hypothetical protein
MSLEALLNVAAHVPRITALLYTDREKAVAEVQKEYDIILSKNELAILKVITPEALTAAIAAAKNSDVEIQYTGERSRGMRSDIP